MNIFNTVGSWFGLGGGTALSDSIGSQRSGPGRSLIDNLSPVSADTVLQISAVWASLALVAKNMATLPLFTYWNVNGNRELARGSALWELLHESPNSRMTPAEFWTALFINLLLRGNAYARLERDDDGNVYAMWPMSADQVEPRVLPDGSMVYVYRLGSDVAILADSSVLHIKEMGNGTVGYSRLDYMRATANEAATSQEAANKLFLNGGKPSGVLMLDRVLNKDQRKAVQQDFAEMALGTAQRLHVLEAGMRYQQINLTPEDIQLLETRQFTIHEFGRWFGIPSILLNSTEGTTTLGSSSGEIIGSFYKTSLRPTLVGIEQAIRKRVMSPAQRVQFTCEYSIDALLRADLSARMPQYATGVQNGIFTRNECRQLENLPPLPGGDELTAQMNLAPLDQLGQAPQTGGNSNATQNPIAQ